MQCDRLKIHKVGGWAGVPRLSKRTKAAAAGRAPRHLAEVKGSDPVGACPATGRAQRPDLVGWLRGDLIADEGLVYLRLRHVRNP